ncbi:hypothetical protein VTK73DRAFT_5911 [Phialemonium thermophilum]|uniref:Uncharacterized protein n=1 Tax=Phialemonium thermophilum TaxID=223376 RepID=A0ABR3WL75_9PEZI
MNLLPWKVHYLAYLGQFNCLKAILTSIRLTYPAGLGRELSLRLYPNMLYSVRGSGKLQKTQIAEQGWNQPPHGVSVMKWEESRYDIMKVV